MFSIIPLKPFNQSKTRLSPALSLNERVDLSRHLLQRTIHIARQFSKVVVVSRAAVVRRLAKQAGAWALVESGRGLNEALRQASTWAAIRGSKAVLVLPGDLPLLKASDLAGMLEAGQRGPAIVIAPCRRLDGTNALFLRPPGLIDFAFGPGSFERHCRAARAIKLKPIIYHSPTLALDLDRPEDLAALQNWPGKNFDVIVKHSAARPQQKNQPRIARIDTN